MSNPINSVLVTTDFSDIAANAVRTAASIAARQGALLHLLHVAEESPSAPADRSPDCALPAESDDARLCRLVNEVESTPGLRCTGRIVSAASVADAVIGYAVGQRCDLIVMGTRALEGVRQFSIGTHAHGVLRRTSVPLLVVPAGATGNGFRSIVFPVRAVPKATEKYGFLRPIIARNDATLHIAGMAEVGQPSAEILVGTAVDVLGRQLEQDGFRFSVERHTVDSMPDAILALAEEKAADLLVITATLEADFLGLFGGSFTKEIMQRATTAVLFLRPGGEAVPVAGSRHSASEQVLPSSTLFRGLHK